MNSYTAPTQEMAFVIGRLAGLSDIATLPGFEEATPELVDTILEEAAKFSQGVLAPLNAPGDRAGCRINAEGVSTAPGWKDAYAQLCSSGWGSIIEPPVYGGQGLPQLVGLAVHEMLASANTAFSLAPLLTGGAVHALLLCADEATQKRYLPPMIAGTWSGTMNLTEPQAGSDLALLRSRAQPEDDGSYRLFGQKIFITYGEHDLTENIIHLVLARLPDAPPGVKGISLFLVPKFLVNPDGTLGDRNDVHCVSLEHKIGIHASPTCVMSFGDNGGAKGFLLGQANRGLEYMFAMMNQARLGVGLQGVALAERANQQAHAYAQERKQGRDALTGEALVSIDHHPDVQRLLMRISSRTQAFRALAYVTAGLLDRAHAAPDAAVRQESKTMAEWLIPIVKGCSSEMSIGATSDAIQVHGGMGYIEETGVAQYWRDARITTIYEGTTGIQANDLVFRKLMRDQGACARALFAQIQDTAKILSKNPDHAFVGQSLADALMHWEAASQWLLAHAQSDTAGVLAGASSYLELSGVVCGGWQMGRALLALEEDPPVTGTFAQQKKAAAHFYAAHDLPLAQALATRIRHGSTGLPLGRPAA
jgi:alkylation response protein AidB-like acyl-CoA dehydrogenase